MISLEAQTLNFLQTTKVNSTPLNRGQNINSTAVQDRQVGTGAYDDDASGGESEDEYQDKPSSSRKKNVPKPKQRRARAEGEEGQVKKRKRTTTKKKKSAYEDIDLSELPPEQGTCLPEASLSLSCLIKLSF